jgi:hypothetical protein
MVNAPHLFKDLKLKDVREVEGIKSGLYIKGMGTIKFKIKDNNGMTHKNKIPNSLYIPELKRCLLSPQNWVQEAKDNYPRPKGTKMEQANEFIMWIGGKPNTESRSPMIRPPTSRLCIPPLCCTPTMLLPPPSKPRKRPLSNGRRFSDSQGAGAPLASLNLYLKSL